MNCMVDDVIDAIFLGQQSLLTCIAELLGKSAGNQAHCSSASISGGSAVLVCGQQVEECLASLVSSSNKHPVAHSNSSGLNCGLTSVSLSWCRPKADVGAAACEPVV